MSAKVALDVESSGSGTHPLRALESEFHLSVTCSSISALHSAMEATDSNNKRKFVTIPMYEWPKLRDVYRSNWPRNSFTYYTLSNYIEWSSKDPDMCRRDVHISSVDGNWEEHGTYLLEDHTKHSYTIQLDTSAPQYNPLMMAALNNLDTSPFYTLLYRENTRPLVEHVLNELGIKELSQGYCPTTLYHLSRDDCLSLQPRPLEGFEVRPLELEHVKRIDDLWTHKHPDSDYLIGRVVKYNLHLGAYDVKNGKLAGWVMHCELGTIAFLQVEEAYRRRGIAEHLVSKLCLLLAKHGLDAIVNITDSNIPSTKLFQKLGFKSIDRVYWYDKDPIELTAAQKNIEQATTSSLKHG